MQSDIFISYKRNDKEKVFPIKDFIEHNTGVKCWIDMDGIESDAQFANVIIKAINNAQVFLFMYSNSHADIKDYENEWTIREITFAQKKGKRIVFVNIDKTPLTDWFELFFGSKQQVDVLSDEAMQKLCKDLKKWLNKDSAPNITSRNEAKQFPEKKSLTPHTSDATCNDIDAEQVSTADIVTEHPSHISVNNQLFDREVLNLETDYQKNVYNELVSILDQNTTEHQYIYQVHFFVVHYLIKLSGFCLKYERDKEVRDIYLVAKRKLKKSKQDEVVLMLKERDYSPYFLLWLLNENVFSIKELYEKNIAPMDVLETALEHKDLALGITAKGEYTYLNNAFDILFLGLPRVGHTSIIAALLLNGYSKGVLFHNDIHGHRLQDSLRYGIQVPESNIGSPSIINAQYHFDNLSANVNFIDNSGSDFLDIAADLDNDIAFSIERTIKGKKRGLSKGENKKIIFLLIDAKFDTYYSRSYRGGDQQMILHQFLRKLMLPVNSDFMQKVCAFHIVFTKLDPQNKDEFQTAISKYSIIINDVTNLCRSHNLKPTRHSFNLGDSYHCGLHRYNEESANGLTRVIQEDLRYLTPPMKSRLSRFLS